MINSKSLKTLVNTPEGQQQGPVNSFVTGKEILDDGYNLSQAKGNPKDGDVQPSSIAPGDENMVHSLYNPLIGIAEHAAKIDTNFRNKQKQYGALSSLSKQTERVQKQEINKLMSPVRAYTNANSPQEPQYADGKSQNLLGISPMARLLPTVAGLAAGINQLAWWKRQDIDTPDTYAPNPYAGRALSTLAGLKDNPYNQLRQMQDVERRGIYETNRAGGLTGSQKYTANVASNIGLQKNYADVLRASNENRNKNLAQYALAALQTGAQDAQNRQNANQFGYTAYRDAHGRKVKGIETGIANILQQLQGGFQNEFKYRMGNKTLEMYLQELDNEKKKIAGLFNNNGGESKTIDIAATTSPVKTKVAPTVATTATAPFVPSFQEYVYDGPLTRATKYIPRTFNVTNPTQTFGVTNAFDDRGVIDYAPYANGYISIMPFYSRNYYNPNRRKK